MVPAMNIAFKESILTSLPSSKSCNKVRCCSPFGEEELLGLPPTSTTQTMMLIKLIKCFVVGVVRVLVVVTVTVAMVYHQPLQGDRSPSSASGSLLSASKESTF